MKKKFKKGDYVFFIVPLKGNRKPAIGGGMVKYINDKKNYMIDTFLGIYFELKQDEAFSTQKEVEDIISHWNDKKN